MSRIFGGFEPKPPDGMWNLIDRQLKRRRRFVMFRWAAIAASVIILLGLGFSLIDTFWTPDKDNYRQSASGNFENKDKARPGDGVNVSNQSIHKEIPVPEERILLSDKANEPEKVILTQLSAPQKIQKARSEAEIAPETIDGQNVKEEEADLLPTDYISNIEIAQNKVDVEESPLPDQAGQTNQPTIIIPEISEQSQPIPSKALKNWGIAMNYGINPAIDLSQEDYALNSNKNNYSHDALSSGLANETSYFAEVEQTNHKSPISIALMVSKQIARKWNLESGITYTKLSYQVKTDEMNFTRREYNTEIFYLGIPLGLRYDIAGKKMLGLYASQMLITEKGINSRITTETFTQGRLNNTDQANWSVRGIQLSSLSALGGDVKISGNLSFFSQAGVQFFFLNKSQPYNIRSARMAWPSFHAGLRVNLK